MFNRRNFVSLIISCPACFLFGLSLPTIVTSPRDFVPAMIYPGEYILPRKYLKHLNKLEKLNSTKKENYV